MTATSFDVAVVGLGVTGGSTALHLARRGVRVLGIDRWAPPHAMGSSHGGTRLIREAIVEGPWYVPLVRRARDLWLELDAEVGGAELFTPTGVVTIGAPESGLLAATIACATRHGIPHDVLDAPALHRRFPALEPFDDMRGVLEPGAGVLWPERIVALQVELAHRAGATLSFGERVLAWESHDEAIVVRTDRGAYHAGRVVLCAGAWNPTLVPVPLPLAVVRQVQEWWEPARHPERFTPERMPVTLWELPDARVFYTMPNAGDGVKVGWHHGGTATDAETLDRDVSPSEHASVTDLLRRFLPQAKGERKAHAVCMYTSTPDRHFIVDEVPGEPRVLLVSACSGHGFKYGSVLGSLVAERLVTGTTAHDLTPFGLARFAA